jgi:uncharacterized membrane protein
MEIVAAVCGLYCVSYVITVLGTAVLFDRPRKKKGIVR